MKDPYRSALTRRGVRIIGAHFDEVVDLQNGELQHQLWLGKSILDQGANFSGLKASGLVSLEGSTIWGDLNLNGAEVGGDLLLDGCALFGNVQLKSAIVHGELRLSGSVVGGKFDGTAMKVDHSLSLDSGAIFNMIDLTGAKSDGDFNLSGSTFNSSVDMTEAQIGGELSLEFNSDADKHSKAVWSADTVLTLRNAKADLIPNSSDIWPENIVLDGFTYRGLSSNGVSEGEAPMTDAVVARSDNFSPQAYEQLATVLQNEGETGRARDVLYALRKAERDHAQDPWRRAGLSVLDWFIGYGYYLERALGWAVVFWFVGGLVMFASGQYRRFGLGPLGSFVYSFDMLLPIIRLRERDYKIDVKGLPQFYFYFHKIMGYILASFLIAGLAGLAK